MTAEVIVLPGEGIGPEVIAEAVKVLEWFQKHRDVHFFIRYEPYGVNAYEKYGTLIKEDVFSDLLSADAVLFGATGGPAFDALPDEAKISGNLLAIRKHMAVYANLRPVQAYDALSDVTSLKAEVVGNVDVPLPIDISAPEALDVLLARAETAVAEAQVSNARAEGRVDPTVGLGVRTVRETGDVGLVAAVSMPLPVFDRNQGNIAAASAQRLAAQARLTDVENRTRAAIDTARADLRAAEARLTALQGSGFDEAKEALRLADLSYRAGKSSLIELLDAQRSLALLQTDLIDAQRARAEAAATLARLAAPFTQGTN